MATHTLAIAKASFSASLLRPDPTSVSRDEIAEFHKLTNLVTSQCSPKNVQNCKDWIFCNIIHSPLRLAAIGKYLVALSGSFTVPATPSATTTTAKEGPSAKRRCIHLLYLANDLLHHAKFCTKIVSVATALQPFLVSLVGNAASYKKSPKHHKKIKELLEIWEDKRYFPADFFEKLQKAVQDAREAAELASTSEHLNRIDKTISGQKLAKNLPFMLPAMHGDQSTPWYDLPAGNLMPQITPNSSRPINPNLVKPLRLAPGLATEELVAAVSQLLQDTNKDFGVTKFANQNANEWDIDELGQPIFHTESAGKYSNMEAYYGWSKEFCDKMKTRQKRNHRSKTHGHAKGRESSRSQSQSHSQSSTQTNQGVKRRRYSTSEDDRGRSRSGSASKRSWRAYSSSRSPSEDGNGSSGQYKNSHPLD